MWDFHTFLIVTALIVVNSLNINVYCVSHKCLCYKCETLYFICCRFVWKQQWEVVLFQHRWASPLQLFHSRCLQGLCCKLVQTEAVFWLRFRKLLCGFLCSDSKSRGLFFRATQKPSASSLAAVETFHRDEDGFLKSLSQQKPELGFRPGGHLGLGAGDGGGWGSETERGLGCEGVLVSGVQELKLFTGFESGPKHFFNKLQPIRDKNAELYAKISFCC